MPKPLTAVQKRNITRYSNRHKTADQISAILQVSREAVEEYLASHERVPENDGGVATKAAKKAVTLPKRA